MNENEFADSILQGVRIAQDIAYCRDWDAFKPVKLKPDPFTRNMKGIAKKFLFQDADAGMLSTLNQGVGVTSPFLNVEEAMPDPDWNEY